MTDFTKLKYSRKMVGKRVAVLIPGGYYFGIVSSVPEWDVFEVDNGKHKSRINIHDIRSAE